MQDVIVPGSAAHVLSLLRSGQATTRPQLARRTGLSRSAVMQRIDGLLSAGLIVEDGHSESSGGRRALQLRFADEAGVTLVADLGKSHARVAITDLAGSVLAERADDQRIDAGPGSVLDWLERGFETLLSEAGRDRADLRGIGIGLPGPVEHSAGRAVSPPGMPGWDGYPVADHMTERFGVATYVDNDVNIMALGEYWAGWRDKVEDLLFIKMGSGIGCGVIIEGRIRRGRQGAAGDIGHIPVSGYEDVTCLCGNTACVGAVASGQAMSNRLAAHGYDATDARDVVKLALAGEADAVREIRQGGRVLGMVLASAVNLLNPEVIVIGGDLAAAQELLLAGITEVVYQRALPLATRGLSIVPARLGDRAGMQGASVMVMDRLFSSAAVDRLLRQHRA